MIVLTDAKNAVASCHPAVAQRQRRCRAWLPWWLLFRFRRNVGPAGAPGDRGPAPERHHQITETTTGDHPESALTAVPHSVIWWSPEAAVSGVAVSIERSTTKCERFFLHEAPFQMLLATL